MRRLFSKTQLRDCSFPLAVILLLASASSTAGLVIVSGPAQPEWTINICQPLQTFDRVSNTLLARPAPEMPAFVLDDLGLNAASEILRLVDRRVAPDTPPPKHS